MIDLIAYTLAWTITLKFAWDYLIFPIIDNIMAIISHLNADDSDPEQDTYVVGFQPPYFDEEDE